MLKLKEITKNPMWPRLSIGCAHLVLFDSTHTHTKKKKQSTKGTPEKSIVLQQGLVQPTCCQKSPPACYERQRVGTHDPEHTCSTGLHSHGCSQSKNFPFHFKEVFPLKLFSTTAASSAQVSTQHIHFPAVNRALNFSTGRTGLSRRSLLLWRSQTWGHQPKAKKHTYHNLISLSITFP